MSSYTSKYINLACDNETAWQDIKSTIDVILKGDSNLDDANYKKAINTFNLNISHPMLTSALIKFICKCALEIEDIFRTTKLYHLSENDDSTLELNQRMVV